MSDITSKQADYVAILQKRLRLPDTIRDRHCRARFGKPYADLSRQECSALIEELSGWEQLPPALLRAMGQTTLPGMGV